MTDRLRVGLIVNPIAGLGGPAALKGTDTDWRRAVDAGYEAQAGVRAARFVAAVRAQGGTHVEWTTCPDAMGVPDLPVVASAPVRAFGESSAADTRAAAAALRDAGMDLICFVGGDGTAGDIAAAVADTVPCLGVPGGVKITSAVFAHDLDEAGWLVAHLAAGFETVPRDVTDLDEDSYRAGRLDTRLVGSLRVPLSPLVQGGKAATSIETSLDGLVDMVLRDWHADALWLVGAGSVCHAVKKKFWGTPTLLGVDAVQGDRIRHSDLDAHAAERLVAEARAAGQDVHIVLSIIGGQGVLLGRGTQILSPAVLRAAGWDRIHVVAPPEKLMGLRGLVVDTGDAALDASAPKFLRVVAGWNETRLVRVNPPPKDSS